MDILPVLLTLMSLIGGSISAPNVTISTDSSTSQYLDAGQVVTLTCQATETPLLHTLMLRAQTPDGPVTVVTNQRVEDAFRKRKRPDGSNRYPAPSYDYNGDEMTVDMRVTINGIKAEDAGRFFCLLQANDQRESRERVTLAVKVPVTDVAMGIILPNGTVEKVADDSQVTVLHGTQGGLACVVRLESYVITPVVNVTVNGVPSEVDFVGGAPNLVEGTTAMYEYTYTYMTSEPHYSLHNSVIRCMAYVKGFENDVQDAQVRANVTFKPVITCVDTKPKATVGGDGVIMCSVVANPGVTKIEVNFGITVTDKTYRFLKGSQKIDKYTLDRQDDGLNVTVTFTIHHMTEALLDDYVYQIKAESDLGSTMQNLRFERGMVSSSSKSLPSWILATIISLIIILKTTSMLSL